MKEDTELKVQRTLLYLIILLTCYLLVSCTKAVYLPVESVRTEYRDVVKYDSIYRHDSVFVLLKGDTVWIEKYKTLYWDRFIRDSVFLQDTLRIPYPVEIPVYTNKLRWYQTALVYTGLIALFVLTGTLLIKRKR